MAGETINPAPAALADRAHQTLADFIPQAQEIVNAHRPVSLEAQSVEAMATPYQRIQGIFEALPQYEPMWPGDNRHGVKLSDGELTIVDHKYEQYGKDEQEFIVDVKSPALEDPDPNMPTKGYGSFRVSEKGVTQITLPNNTNIQIDDLDTNHVYDRPTSIMFHHKPILGPGSNLSLNPDTKFGRVKGEQMIAWAEQMIDANSLVQFPEMTIMLSAPVPSENENGESKEIDYSTPFKVRILRDYRNAEEYGPSGDLTGHYGICVGEFNQDTLEPDEEGIPLIITATGEEIWGDQSYWDPNPDEHTDIPFEQQQEALDRHIAALRISMGIDAPTESSDN